MSPSLIRMVFIIIVNAVYVATHSMGLKIEFFAGNAMKRTRPVNR